MRKILIDGSGGPAGIGFTRCIKQSPEEIFTVGTEISERTVFLSETDRAVLIRPDGENGYIDILNQVIDKYDIDFVHAQPDNAVKIISEHREKLKAKTFLPSKEAVKICHDKLRSYETWKEAGVPVPETLLIRNETDLAKAMKKFGRTWLRATHGSGGRGSLLVRAYEHAEAWIDYWNGWGNFTASEYLPGGNFGWEGVFMDGQLLYSNCKERLEYVLQKASPSGVTGTAGVLKGADRHDADELALKAIHAVDKMPQGIFSVDMKEDTNGMLRVTEINPGRFLGSSVHYFYMTGIIMPYIYVKAAFGETVPLIVSERFKKFGGCMLVRSLDKAPVLLSSDRIESEVKEANDKGFSVVK